MLPKQIIALATHHHVQLKGHALNDRFGRVISLIREKYPVQIILEEWTPDRQSFASTRGYGQVEMGECRDTQREALSDLCVWAKHRPSNA